jgi:glycosyltransferase involved in cell wall biosynthesis
MQVKVSVACLIYKSVRWLKFVYDQVKKYTNLNENEFYFVANDACDEVLIYLRDNNIPHYIHNNTTEQRKEWYINNVYRAWNTAGRVAKGEYVVFINSDMAFTPGWLERLMEKYDDSRIVMSRLVERGVLTSGLYGIEKNFGNIPGDYKEDEFIEYANSISKDELYKSGLYMPCLIKKKYLEAINYYPEGNIVPGSDIFNPVYAKLGENCTPGDHVFIKKLNTLGIQHWTVFNSIVYHFQEGEMRDTS